MVTTDLRTVRSRARPAPVRTRRARWIAIAVWALLIVVAFGWGQVLLRSGRLPYDALPPLHAEPRLPTWRILPAVGVAVVFIGVLPVLSRRLAWRPLLVASWLAAVVWTVALALADGPEALTRPLTAHGEYFPGLAPVLADPAGWLSTFTERLLSYPTHVAGHPPLPMLFLWALHAVGLGGPGWAAAVIIAIGCSAVVAIAVTLRVLGGEEWARRALPFLVLAPLAVWIATSMDALFLGVGAWAVALLALSARGGGVAAGFLSGVLLGTLPYLSYGLLPFFALPVAVAIALFFSRPPALRAHPPCPRRSVIAVVLAGAAVVPVACTAGGFWWPDGVAATHAAYLITGGSAYRPYLYFLVANLAVLGLLTGPAVAYAGPSSRRIGMVVGAALLAVVVLDLSGVTRGEVERIWLPYAAWLIAATAAHRLPARHWLAAQAAVGIALQAFVLSNW